MTPPLWILLGGVLMSAMDWLAPFAPGHFLCPGAHFAHFASFGAGLGFLWLMVSVGSAH